MEDVMTVINSLPKRVNIYKRGSGPTAWPCGTPHIRAADSAETLQFLFYKLRSKPQKRLWRTSPSYEVCHVTGHF